MAQRNIGRAYGFSSNCRMYICKRSSLSLSCTYPFPRPRLQVKVTSQLASPILLYFHISPLISTKSTDMDLANNYTEHDQSITTSQGEGIDLPHETKEQDPSNAIQDQETQHPDLDLAPDGGAKAWLVAAGGFSVCFCCLGFSNAFGTFEEYYLKHQLHGESASNIAWIGSTSAFLQFAAGMIGGPMFDRFGAKASLSWLSRYRFGDPLT